MSSRVLFWGILVLLGAGIIAATKMILFPSTSTGPSILESTSQSKTSRQEETHREQAEHRSSDSPSRDENPFKHLSDEDLKLWTPEVQSSIQEIDSLLDAGRYGEAEERLLAEIQNHPQMFSFNARLADLYLQTSSYSKAEPILENLVQIEPENAFFRSKLAEVETIQNKPEQAVENYKAALDLDPQFGPAAAGFIVASSTTPEKLNEAITYIQDKMAQNPNGNLAAVVVESLIMSGKQADAEAALNQYLGEYPDHSELNHLKAAKQIMQGNWREGQESALRSLRLDQDLKRVEKRGQSYAEEALMAGEVNSAERMIQEMENRQISSEVIDILKKEIEEAKKAQRPNPK